MKTELTSLLRHALTALAGIGALLAARGCIAPEDSAAVDAAGLSVAEGVIVIVVAVVSRLALSWMGKLGLAAKSGGTAPLWIMGWLLAGMSAASLTSCADYQGPRFLIGLENDQGRVSYDSEAGGSVRVDAKVPSLRGTK